MCACSTWAALVFHNTSTAWLSYDIRMGAGFSLPPAGERLQHPEPRNNIASDTSMYISSGTRRDHCTPVLRCQPSVGVTVTPASPLLTRVFVYGCVSPLPLQAS
jgi:hypothetical protein